jgi:hypothetical protein
MMKDHDVIQKVVHKAALEDTSEIQENLAYWLSRAPAERVEAVELLRRQAHGNAPRLQRVAKVLQQAAG